MMSGMGRVFTYENQAPNPLIPNPKLAKRKLFADDRKFHFMFENDFASNGNDGEMMLQNKRWSIGTEWRLGYSKMHGFETETHIGRYVDKMQFLQLFVGFDYRYRMLGMAEVEKNLFQQKNSKDHRILASVGLEYTMPLLIKLQAEVYHNGYVRIQLMRTDIPLTKRLRMDFMVNTDAEYMVGLKYIINKHLGAKIHYDSDMGFGAGLTVGY
jgi:hypothetical protein